MLTTIDENLGFDFMREQVVFAPIPTVIGYIRAGKLCALAVTSATRLEVLLNVPTVAEFMPGYEASTWSGIGAPKSTSSTMRSTQASPILNLWRSSQT
jgi:tripartite-type tricarboxylate transporter receptor subunit TctC